MRLASRIAPLGAFLLVSLLIGCGGSAPESLRDARDALGDAQYGDALDAARAGLAQAPDDVQRWGLELVVLEALARTGQGEAAMEQLAVVESLQPQAVPATLYAATADQLRAAGDGPGAILVLDRGFQRFPENAALETLIAAAKQAPSVDADELELLRTLGYIE